MKTTFLKTLAVIAVSCIAVSCRATDEGTTVSDSIVIDHTCTDIFSVPVENIEAARSQLVIAYGHTSHGSQLVTGMDGLDNFMTARGYAEGTFRFNNGGSDGALELRDLPFDINGDTYIDLGQPDRETWATLTRTYLNSHAEVNVVMWSWCGQVAWSTSEEIDLYLSLMSGLETDFPNVKFVYMTCHLDGTGKEGQLNQNNERIRSYCKANKKILFDFADIESYDPDGSVNYMELYANDNCDYTTSGGESRNWATDWQNSHTENVDWYDCSPAHSQALNGNQKAFAAWWMFARMAGWNPYGGSSVAFNQCAEEKVSWSIANNCLNLVMPSMRAIDRIEIFKLNGQVLYAANREMEANKVIIPLSGLGFSPGECGLFRVVADGNVYTGKFMNDKF